MRANERSGSSRCLLLLSILLSWFATHGFLHSAAPPVKPRTVFPEVLQVSAASVSVPAWSDGGKVEVCVVKDLPCVYDPCEALDAWMVQHWKKGGGLPIFVRSSKREEDPHDSSSSSPWLGTRSILPILMEEAIYKVDETSPASRTLQYTVSNPGPLFAPHLVADSHDGSVSFEPADDEGGGYKMTWNVEFETTRYQRLYQAVTEFTVGIAARTVAESLSIPRLLTLETKLSGQDDPVEARRTWLEFFWARGGGLPLPPPIPFGTILEEGGGTARENILRVPPLLIDKVLSASTTASAVDAVYQIKDPGWNTFPFLIHTHLGRAQFRVASRDDEGVELVWEIQVRPFPVVSTIVEKLLEMTASTIIRNLAVHIVEPGARVEIKAPRGKLMVEGVDSFGSVPKDCWLGGVLDAHLRDSRSSMEQTISLVKPWTWGRSGTGDEKDYVTFSWSDGKMKD